MKSVLYSHYVLVAGLGGTDINYTNNRFVITSEEDLLLGPGFYAGTPHYPTLINQPRAVMVGVAQPIEGVQPLFPSSVPLHITYTVPVTALLVYTASALPPNIAFQPFPFPVDLMDCQLDSRQNRNGVDYVLNARLVITADAVGNSRNVYAQPDFDLPVENFPTYALSFNVGTSYRGARGYVGWKIQDEPFPAK